jgi:DNA processing protein
MRDDLKYWVWLSSLSSVPPAGRLKLIEIFGHPEMLWHVKAEHLAAVPFMTKSMFKQLQDESLRQKTQESMEKLQCCGIKALTIKDIDYPQKLKQIFDPPAVLYVRGRIEKEMVCVAVVGSRKATSYGLNVARELSRQLSEIGLTVVSGMARGIDSCAHKGSKDFKGGTIAVLGCGPDIAYPSENRYLMEQIVQKGAVISEYPPGTRPMPQNFPARNRIISGISEGVVIVEAGVNSGSLITANFALDQGREVFAVPGNIDSINSVGTNKLISEGAKLIASVHDIVSELNLNIGSNNPINS